MASSSLGVRLSGPPALARGAGRLIAASRLVIAAALALGCGGGAHGTHGAQAPASTDPNPGEIKHLIASLTLEEPDAERRFSAELRAKLPPPLLNRLWRNLLAQNGALRAFNVVGADRPHGKQRYLVELDFEHGVVDAQFAFEPANGELIGLFFARPRLSAAAAREDAAQNPPDPTVQEITLSVGTAPLLLGASLTMPRQRGDARLPAVLLVGGSGPNDRDETVQRAKPFRDIAHELARRNIVTLRFDKRTHAYPTEFARGRQTVEEEELADAVSAAAVLRARPEVDPSRLYVLGHSLGAFIAPEIAARSGHVVGLVLVAGPDRPFPQTLLDQLLLAGVKPDQLEPLRRQIEALPTLRADTLVGGAPAGYWQDLNRRDETGTAKKLGVPILYLRGENDRNVLLVEQKHWEHAFEGNALFHAETLPGLNHLLLPSNADLGGDVHVAPAVIGKIADFVLARPAAPAP